MILNWAIARKYLAAAKGKVTDDQLNNALNIVTPSTVGSPQLGSIRAITAALNSFMPRYISSDVNFSQDDQTMLRVYVAHHYPCVEENDAARLIRDIIQARRAKSGNDHVNPWGFTEAQIKLFKSELATLHRKGVQLLSSPKTSGSGQTQFA
jgi:hypothetical protein